ncbi:NAD-binding protein [Phytohabitans sp. ZYX-F-186]|uniref:NAD-binding protein n=1 Tax=Phytohabitans maris TaxID=3071409 RepID=A0ABU0ZFN2_9ACTN|nr:NAD-binding protein [Phytohabitans sp. ZYX-F-186]MDQ7904762.1 NAD-binding protein [Phytohabitans sp. ZYX-F-186]
MGDSARFSDVLYNALQLFVLGSPATDDGGPYPLSLEIARFAAPAVTFYALVEALRLVFAAEAERLRARRARGHVVICGDGPVATTLSRQLRAAGHLVVHIADSRSGAVGSRRSLLWVLGDARDPEVLRAAGVARASALYACAEDSATNTAIALAAGRRQRGERPLAVYAQVQDQELCLALQARHLGTSEPPTIRLDFFNIDDVAARHLLAKDPIVPPLDRPPRFLVVGATAFGRAVVVELARQWRVLPPAAMWRVEVAVVDDAATQVIDELSFRYPFLSKACDLRPYDGDLLAVLAGKVAPEAPDRVFICHDDEQVALKTALIADRLWRGGPGTVIVRQDQLATLQDAFDGARDERLFDEVSGTLRLFGVVDAACDPGLIRDDLGERLARVVHESYRAARRRRGDGPDDSPSLAPWPRLADLYKVENRAQATDIGRKLRAIECVLAPRVAAGQEYVFTTQEVTRLAITEHERWLQARLREGWRFAEAADYDRMLHPGIRRWDDLPESIRRVNSDAIRELPGILADYGFRIVRMREGS